MGGSPAEAAPLVDAVLEHGRIRARLTAAGPAEEPEFADPAWLVARDHLDLLGRAPERIRTCAGGDCVLRFFDTSRNGTRRWCTVAACGNRPRRPGITRVRGRTDQIPGYRRPIRSHHIAGFPHTLISIRSTVPKLGDLR